MGLVTAGLLVALCLRKFQDKFLVASMIQLIIAMVIRILCTPIVVLLYSRWYCMNYSFQIFLFRVTSLIYLLPFYIF